MNIQALGLARLCKESYAHATLSFGSVLRVMELGATWILPGTRIDHPLDLMTDLDCEAIETGYGQAHCGFWREAALGLAEAVAQGPKVLCGHSMGAAFAVNLATMLALCGHEPAAVVGFGCPGTAYGPWQRDVLKKAGVTVDLYRNGGDPVPGVPSWATHAADFTQIGGDSFLPRMVDHEISAYVTALGG
jgi:hypothetical protein